ncbi:phosphatase PAP2 family protein [Streptomyces sp. ODS28]|uniref:phosphatase PAP2 family protein n=1 Tax=Streptomyces sp. ODS28 TaxID=3136688 RepID=UPI0031E700DB
MPGPTPPRAAPLLLAALPLAALSAFVLLCAAAGWQPLMELDRTVAVRLHEEALAHPGWTRTHRVLTDWVWDPLTVRLLLAAAALWLLTRGEWPLVLWIAATALVAAGVQQGLKAALGRDRPRWSQPVDSAHYAALPSGHAMTAAFGCVLLLWLAHRAGLSARVRRLALAAACVSVAGVSLTRVWLGVHWVSDTVAGALLGTALALAAAAGGNALAARRHWQAHSDPGSIRA